jgi:hypothetical protein
VLVCAAVVKEADVSKLLVVHDLKGKLIAVGEMHAGGPRGVEVGVQAMDGQGVFETERADELMGMTLHEIHKGYRADLRTKKLVKG